MIYLLMSVIQAVTVYLSIYLSAIATWVCQHAASWSLLQFPRSLFLSLSGCLLAPGQSAPALQLSPALSHWTCWEEKRRWGRLGRTRSYLVTELFYVLSCICHNVNNKKCIGAYYTHFQILIFIFILSLSDLFFTPDFNWAFMMINYPPKKLSRKLQI